MIAKEREDIYQDFIKELDKITYISNYEIQTGQKDKIILRFSHPLLNKSIELIQKLIDPDVFRIYIIDEEIGITLYNFKEGQKRLKKEV